MLYEVITYSNGAGPYDGTKGQVWKLNLSTGIWTDISPVSSTSDDNYYGYGGRITSYNVCYTKLLRVVMEQGRVAEYGTPEQLIEGKGAFYHLMVSQQEGYDEG